MNLEEISSRVFWDIRQPFPEGVIVDYNGPSPIPLDQAINDPRYSFLFEPILTPDPINIYIPQLNRRNPVMSRSPEYSLYDILEQMDNFFQRPKRGGVTPLETLEEIGEVYFFGLHPIEMENDPFAWIFDLEEM